MPAPVNIDYLTTDEEVRKRVKARNKKIVCTAPQMGAMITRGKKLVDKNYVAQFVNRPVALFHGTGDLVNDFKGTFECFELLPVDDKKMYRYPDYYHDFFHETPERVETVMTDIKDWLLAHTEPSSSADTAAERAEVKATAEAVEERTPEKEEEAEESVEASKPVEVEA